MSGEKLDKQIFDDAEKKALAIAEEAEAAIIAAKNRRTAELKAALENAKARFDQKAEERRTELESCLTLDKRRLEWEKTENNLKTAASEFLRSFLLDRSKAIDWVARTFAARANECLNGDFSSLKTNTVHAHSVSRSEAELILKKAFPSVSDWNIKEEKEDKEENFGIVLDFDKARIVVDARAEIDELILSKRAELVSEVCSG